MTRLFETLYPPRPYEQAPLGKRWCLEGHPGYGEELLCAAYPRNGDEGCDVRVYRTAMPAAFYRIEAGDLSFSTGSSMHQLTAQIAAALATGTLVFTLAPGEGLSCTGTERTQALAEAVRNAIADGMLGLS